MLEDIILNRIYTSPYSNKVTKQEAQEAKYLRLERKIKSKHGIGRESGEQWGEYFKRVELAVNYKGTPLSWCSPLREKFLKNATRHDETTRKVKKVVHQFFGIQDMPVDAFVGETPGNAQGMNISEPDGSGVMVIGTDTEDDYLIDMRTFQSEISDYLTGKHIKTESRGRKFMALTRAGDKEQRALFRNWLGNVFRNFDYVALHEAIHNLDGNSRPSHTKYKLNWINGSRKFLSMVPFVRHINNYTLNKYTVDMETTAFKVGTDAYIEKSFNHVRSNMTLDQEQSKQLYELEQSFYQMSSDFSKKTVTKVYLNQRGLSSAGLTAAKIGSAYLLYTLFEKETVDGFWSAVSEGYSMLQYARMCIHSADALSGLPTFYHLKHKASKYVNAWHDLLRRDGIREGFINTLGQSADERSYSPRTCCQSAKGCHIEADTFI